MAVWQFTALACLSGALLVFVGVLTAMVRVANFQLKKVAEVLHSFDRQPAKAGGPGAVTRAHSSVGVTGNAAKAAAEEATSRSGYLTLRDLRAQQRSGSASSSVRSATAPPDPRFAERLSEQRTLGKIDVVRRRPPGAAPTAEGYVPSYLRNDLEREPAKDVEEISAPSAETPAAVISKGAPIEPEAPHRVDSIAAMHGSADVPDPQVMAGDDTENVTDSKAAAQEPQFFGRERSNAVEAHAISAEPDIEMRAEPLVITAVQPEHSQPDATIGAEPALPMYATAIAEPRDAVNAETPGPIHASAVIVDSTFAKSASPVFVTELAPSRADPDVAMTAPPPAAEAYPPTTAHEDTLPGPLTETGAHRVLEQAPQPVAFITEHSSGDSSSGSAQSSCVSQEHAQSLAAMENPISKSEIDTLAIDKRKRDAVLFQNYQRRRRRAGL